MPAGRTALVAVLTVLVLAGLAFGAYWLLAGGPSNSVTVPSVVGSTRQAAEQELREAGLQPAFRNVAGPDEDVGTVIRQLPGSGTEVAAGTTVTAEINVGPATERIPKDLVGRDVDEVVEELTEAGFSNVTAVPVADPPAGAETDEVVAVDPGEGEKAAPEEDITVSYVGRAVRKPTTGTQPRSGASESRRPSETEASAEKSEEGSGESSQPGEDTSSEEPSADPSESSEPEPSESEPSESEPSGTAPSGGGAPSAEAPSEPPIEEPEDAADRCRPGRSQPAGRRLGRQSDAPGGVASGRGRRRGGAVPGTAARPARRGTRLSGDLAGPDRRAPSRLGRLHGGGRAAVRVWGDSPEAAGGPG